MKSGYIAIIGKPNTGKSTLLNRILKVKLAAVSRKAQTTRSKILGIYHDEEIQIIFIDTPGTLKAKNTMEKLMNKDISNSMKDADIICILVDDIQTVSDFRDLENLGKPVFLIINKIDRMKNEKILEIINNNKDKGYTEIIALSALKDINIDKFLKALTPYLPYDHFFYPDDYISDKPERFFVSEFIREQVFKIYGEEIPYSTGVVVEEFKERENGKTFIRVNVYIEKESQKGIIIGAGGKKVKELGVKSRVLIEEFLDTSVYLEIQVKIKKNWKDNTLLLNRMWNY